LPETTQAKPEDALEGSVKKKQKGQELTTNPRQTISFTNSKKSDPITRQNSLIQQDVRKSSEPIRLVRDQTSKQSRKRQAKLKSPEKWTPPNPVANHSNSFNLETVRSVDNDEWGTPSFLQCSPRKSVGKNASPNWKSQGRSRTDHLLKSIDFDSSRNKKGIYDAFGMRRDPEAQHKSSDQKEPEGIMGIQLTESSSRESGMSENKSLFSGKSEQNESGPGLVKTHSKLKSYYDRRQSLIDVDLTMSSSDSVKSPEDLFDDREPPRKQQMSFPSAGKNPVQRRKDIPDDESSVFSNLPVGSITPSLQRRNDTHSLDLFVEGNQKDTVGYPIERGNQSDCGEFYENESEAALFEGQRPANSIGQKAKVMRTVDVTKKRTESEGKLPNSKIVKTECDEVSSNENGSAPSIGHCITSESDSSGKTRAFWNSLANFKTLGSFDSDSIINETSGRRIRQNHRPFIDRNPDNADADIAKSAHAQPSSCPALKKESIFPLKQQTQQKFPHQSDARYLSGAPIAEKNITQEERQHMRQSAVWMAPIPEQKSLEDTDHFVPKKTGKPEKTEESALFSIMGPLMSADTDDEEEVTTFLTDDFTTTLVTDDFTRPDDSGSVAAQQSCYSSCDSFNLSNIFGWFYSS
jgi:hypothetical protein